MNTGPQLNINVANGAAYDFSGTIISPNVNSATRLDKRGAGQPVLSASSTAYTGN